MACLNQLQPGNTIVLSSNRKKPSNTPLIIMRFKHCASPTIFSEAVNTYVGFANLLPNSDRDVSKLHALEGLYQSKNIKFKFITQPIDCISSGATGPPPCTWEIIINNSQNRTLSSILLPMIQVENLMTDKFHYPRP